MSNPNTMQRNTNIVVSVDAGTDTLSGLSTNDSDYLLEVSTANHDGTSCETFGSYVNTNLSEIASATQYTYSNTVINTCYKFRYTVQDEL